MGIRHMPFNPPQENVAQVLLFPILLINFIGSLGFSIVLPFLAFLVTRLGGNAFVYGLMGASYPAFQLVGAPILGRWSDIYGRRRILLLSQIGTLVSWVMFLIALFLPAMPIFRANSGVFGSFVLTLPLLVLFLGRALDGITGGNVSVANAYLAAITEETDRSEKFGKMAISSNLGFIIGPALGGLLGATVYGELLPVFAALLISLAGTSIIYFRLSESRPCVIERDPERLNVRKVFGQEQKECYFPEGSKDVRVKDVLLLERIPYMLLLIFLIFLGFNVFYTAFPVHAIENLDWSTTELGIYISVLSGMMVVVQGAVLGRLSKRYSDAVLIVVGSAVLGTNFLLLAGGDVVLTYFAAVFFALGNGLMWPSLGIVAPLKACRAGTSGSGAGPCQQLGKPCEHRGIDHRWNPLRRAGAHDFSGGGRSHLCGVRPVLQADLSSTESWPKSPSQPPRQRMVNDNRIQSCSNGAQTMTWPAIY